MVLAAEGVDEFALFSSVSWNMPRRVEQTPQIENRNQSSKQLVGLVFFNFP